MITLEKTEAIKAELAAWKTDMLIRNSNIKWAFALGILR